MPSSQKHPFPPEQTPQPGHGFKLRYILRYSKAKTEQALQEGTIVPTHTLDGYSLTRLTPNAFKQHLVNLFTFRAEVPKKRQVAIADMVERAMRAALPPALASELDQDNVTNPKA